MMKMLIAAGLVLGLSTPALACDVVEKDIATLSAHMAAGRVSAAELVHAYQARIAQVDPLLHSVIALNPGALAGAGRGV